MEIVQELISDFPARNPFLEAGNWPKFRPGQFSMFGERGEVREYGAPRFPRRFWSHETGIVSSWNDFPDNFERTSCPVEPAKKHKQRWRGRYHRKWKCCSSSCCCCYSTPDWLGEICHAKSLAERPFLAPLEDDPCCDDKHARGVQRLGRAGIRRFRPRGGHQNSPFRG